MYLPLDARVTTAAAFSCAGKGEAPKHQRYLCYGYDTYHIISYEYDWLYNVSLRTKGDARLRMSLDFISTLLERLEWNEAVRIRSFHSNLFVSFVNWWRAKCWGVFGEQSEERFLGGRLVYYVFSHVFHSSYRKNAKHHCFFRPRLSTFFYKKREQKRKENKKR